LVLLAPDAIRTITVIAPAINFVPLPSLIARPVITSLTHQGTIQVRTLRVPPSPSITRDPRDKWGTSAPWGPETTPPLVIAPPIALTLRETVANDCWQKYIKQGDIELNGWECNSPWVWLQRCNFCNANSHPLSEAYQRS
jgi:hypothetical protein